MEKEKEKEEEGEGDREKEVSQDPLDLSGMRAIFRSILADFFRGLRDSLNLVPCFFYLRKSSSLRGLLAQIFRLNFLLFLLGLLSLDFIQKKTLSSFSSKSSSLFFFCSSFLYLIGWAVPVYLFSFVVNIFYYQDVFSCVSLLKLGEEKVAKSSDSNSISYKGLISRIAIFLASQYSRRSPKRRAEGKSTYPPQTLKF